MENVELRKKLKAIEAGLRKARYCMSVASLDLEDVNNMAAGAIDMFLEMENVATFNGVGIDNMHEAILIVDEARAAVLTICQVVKAIRMQIDSIDKLQNLGRLKP